MIDMSGERANQGNNDIRRPLNNACTILAYGADGSWAGGAAMGGSGGSE